ncbi:MAG: hypothetical protein V1875_09020 [Candidatus Altiarchaeota archaeon]
MAYLLLCLAAGFGSCLENNSARCNGCVANERCLTLGFRVVGEYCWIDGNMQPQKADDETCENGFECRINKCLGGYCRDKEPVGLYEELKDWIFHISRFVVVKRI